MSKIGRIPVIIEEGVSVEISGQNVKVTGPKGTLSFSAPDGITVSQENGEVIVTTPKENQDVSALYGLARAIIANMVKGVYKGFEKKLELSGVGYRASVNGKDLILSVGFSHPVKISAPDGIQFSVSENVITISGIDKGLVGEWAAKIRSIKEPEPYKGKGILYKGERIRRKAGKAAKAVGAAK